MGRMTSEMKNKYQKLGNVLLEDGRMVIQKGTSIECLSEDCNYEGKVKKFFIGKYYQCPNCKSSKSLLFDGKEKGDLSLEGEPSEDDEDEEEEKEEEDEEESFDTKVTRLNQEYFDDSDEKIVNKEVMEKSRGKDLTTFLRNISKRDLVKSFMERQGLDEEQKDTLIDVLNERKLLKKAKRYEERYKELVSNKPRKKLWRKKPELEEEEEGEEEGEEEEEEIEEKKLARKIKALEEREKIVKGKVEDVLKKKPKLKRLTDYFSVEGIAKAIVQIDVSFLNVWFSKEEQVDEEEKESLEYIWELAVDFYGEDIEKLMSWMSIVLLVLMHLAIVGKRARKWWERRQKGTKASKGAEERLVELRKEEGEV